MAAEALKTLGWEPEVDFAGLVRMMVEADLELLGSRAGNPNPR